jgi:hypothetical protein
MSLETYTGKISDLVDTNPTGTDPRSQGDDHLRGIKYTLKQSFPLATGPVRVSGDKLFAGDSATQANNFVIDASADNGTMKLARESGQDIMTVDVAGKVAFPQMAIINNGPAARAYLSANQTVVVGQVTKLNLDTESFDTNNCFSGGRFTPNVAGYYQVSAQGRYTSEPPAACGFFLYKNGSALITTGDNTSSSYGTTFAIISDIVYMNGTTDYLELFGRGDTGTASRSFGSGEGATYMSVCLVREG